MKNSTTQLLKKIKKLYGAWVALILAIALSLLYIISPTQTTTARVIYPPGSLLQPEDVTSTHIRDGTIVNADINASAAIAWSKINKTGSSIADLATKSILDTTDTLTVSRGGTGATTFTVGGVLVGNGTNSILATGAGTAGQILTSNGAGQAPTFQAVPSPTKIVKSYTAGEAIAAGDAVYVSDGTEANVIITENQEIDDGNANFGYDSNQAVAQSLNLNANTLISKIEVALHKVGTPTDNVVVALQASSGGQPSGTDLVSDSISGTTLTTTRTLYQLTWNYIISTTGTYFIVLKRSGAFDATNYYVSAQKTPTSTYSGGTYWQNQYGTWTEYTNRDLTKWKIYMQHEAGRVYKTSANTTGKYNTYIGIANTTQSTPTQSVEIVIAGEATTLSGLTTGKQYYLSNTSGAISTTPGTNSRKAGISTSATSLVITNNW